MRGETPYGKDRRAFMALAMRRPARAFTGRALADKAAAVAQW